MSIRTHAGPIDLCGSCGQPCYLDEEIEYGPQWMHFTEQWDGVACQWFPLAGEPLDAKLDQMSVDDIHQRYPDTYPHQT